MSDIKPSLLSSSPKTTPAVATTNTNNKTYKTDIDELHRFLKTQHERNYNHIPTDWDNFVKNVISKLTTSTTTTTTTTTVASLSGKTTTSLVKNVTGSINPQNGDTLLHLMFMGFPSPSAVEALLDYHYRHRRRRDDNDDMTKKTPTTTISSSYSNTSSSFVSRANFAGVTPLHVGLTCHAPLASIALLLKYHDLQNETDNEGYDDEKEWLPLSGIPLPGGTYPLHIACRYSRRRRIRHDDELNDDDDDGPASLRMIVDDYPSLLSSDRRPPDDDNVATTNRGPPRLLHLLWKTHGSSLEYDRNNDDDDDVIVNGESLVAVTHPIYTEAAESLQRARRRSTVWDMATIILSDIDNKEENDDASSSHRRCCSRPLFHLAQYPYCPPGFITLACDVNPNLLDQLMERDEMGRVPLHYAAMASSHKWADIIANEYDETREEEEGDRTDDTPLFPFTTTTTTTNRHHPDRFIFNHDVTTLGYMTTRRNPYNNNLHHHLNDTVGNSNSNHHPNNNNNSHHRPQRQSSLVETLLSKNPKASRLADNYGRLPLHYAVAAFLKRRRRDDDDDDDKDDVRAIATAYPDGLTILDPVTKCYPFMMAGGDGETGDGDDETLVVGLCFDLLKRRPEVVNRHYLMFFSSSSSSS